MIILIVILFVESFGKCDRIFQSHFTNKKEKLVVFCDVSRGYPLLSCSRSRVNNNDRDRGAAAKRTMRPAGGPPPPPRGRVPSPGAAPAPGEAVPSPGDPNPAKRSRTAASLDASAAVTATGRAAGSAPAPAASHFPATYGGFGGAMDPYTMARMMAIYQRYGGTLPPAPAVMYYGAPPDKSPPLQRCPRC